MHVVTIRDLARACGVGMTTVSRALNGQDGVSAATRGKVMEAARELGYEPNQSARALRRSNSDAIAVIVKGPNNPFFSELLEKFEGRLRRDGYVVNLVRVLHGDDEVEATTRAVAASRVCGLLLLGGWFTAEPADVRALRMPMVLCTMPVMSKVDASQYSSVAVDDSQAMDAIVEHLVSEGHTKIGFIGPEHGDESIGFIRLTKFEEAMRRHGLEPDPDLTIRGSSQDFPYSFEYGHLVTTSFLEKKRDVTALVAMTDAVAVGAMRAIADVGLSVPGDIAVTGIDGIELGRYACPRLTTIEQPIDEIVDTACQMLTDKIEGGSAQHKLIPGTLRVMESSRAVAC